MRTDSMVPQLKSEVPKMKSTHVTNFLLFVIAMCFLTMVSRQLGPISVANAQSPAQSPPVNYAAALGWNVKQPIPVKLYNSGGANDQPQMPTKPQ
jgi:hypothetical protein